MSGVIQARKGALLKGSAVEQVEEALERIARLDPALGSFITVDREGAVAQAKRVDQKQANGRPLGALAGTLVGLKDIFLTRGLRTTCASKTLKDFVPPYDGTVVTRLRAADAIIIGKLNMDEFAMGSSNENSAFGLVHNPWDLERAPGGSSGGSGAAVAASLCDVAMGTDTGGSIRQPASFCGIVGLKPTYGRISRFGVIAFASSLDQPGPMGRTVRDVATTYAAVAGYDPYDATSAERTVEPIELATGCDLTGVRLGIPAEYFPKEGLEDDVRSRLEDALRALQDLGAEVVPISLPHTKHAIAAYYLIATAEASSNLARYDGVRFGHRAKAADLQEMYTQTRGALGDEVRRRLMLGTFALSAGYYEAYYQKASQVRTLIRQNFEAAFARVDAVITPTSPTTAFRLGERAADPLSMYLADIFTVPCNLAGLPGLSVPCGFDSGGLPVGLQVIGRPFDEPLVLRIGAAYEDATSWTERRPPEAI